MTREAGVDHACDLRMLLEKGRDVHRVAAVALHPDGECLDAAQGEEGVERTRYAADGVLEEGKLLLVSGIPQYGGAADDVRVAVQVLGGRVHHDVEAELEGPLYPGRSEGVVAHGNDAALARHRRDGFQVDQLEQRVGRALDPQHARAGP